MKPLLIFDTETTGVTSSDSVCQIAAVLADPTTFEVVDTFKSLVNPQRRIHPQAAAIHGISDAMVRTAPLLTDVFSEKLSDWFVQADIICGHNVKFDIRMTQSVLPEKEYAVLDTLSLVRCRFPGWSNHKLQTAVAILELPQRQAHDALGDVLSCLDLLKAVAQEGETAYELQRYASTCMADKRRNVRKRLGV